MGKPEQHREKWTLLVMIWGIVKRKSSQLLCSRNLCGALTDGPYSTVASGVDMGKEVGHVLAYRTPFGNGGGLSPSGFGQNSKVNLEGSVHNTPFRHYQE